MTHIVPLITERIADHLTTKLQTLVSADDPIRANEVKVGRFQDTPTDFTVWVAVQAGDPEEPNAKDGIVSLGDFENIHVVVPPREIGGGSRWWRRGVIQFGCYFIDREEDEARNLSYEVVGRICNYLETVKVSDLLDDFDEQAIKTYLFGQTMFEGGGPGSYIWRGKVLWQCLTERSI
jgi:hypothetical protein